MGLVFTCYMLITNAMRIFASACTARAARTSGVAHSPLSPGPGVHTEFELKQGEVVKFNDFLKALPKAEENEAEEDDEEEGLIQDKDLAVV